AAGAAPADLGRRRQRGRAAPRGAPRRRLASHPDPRRLGPRSRAAPHRGDRAGGGPAHARLLPAHPSAPHRSPARRRSASGRRGHARSGAAGPGGTRGARCPLRAARHLRGRSRSHARPERGLEDAHRDRRARARPGPRDGALTGAPISIPPGTAAPRRPRPTEEDAMSWKGQKVIDLDAHIRERPDAFYRECIDPAYRDAYDRLCEAIAAQAKAGEPYALVGRRTAIVDPIETGRPLGVTDTFGLSRRSRMERGRLAFPPGRAEELPPIRHEVSWDVAARLEDMDRAQVDVAVLYPTHVSSYCALRDSGFENALYRAHPGWVSEFSARAPSRLKWALVATMRDVDSGVAEIRHWVERDSNLVGVYLSPQAPEGKLLDNPALHPLYQTAQDLELPLLVHGGTARPPYAPGTFDLDGAWYLLHSFGNPWAGLAALGSLIGGGIFELFPYLRVAIIETGGGGLPLPLHRLHAHLPISPP